jgi:HEAT repeat protein
MRRLSARSIAWGAGAIVAAIVLWVAGSSYFHRSTAAPFSGLPSDQPPDFVDRTADFGLTVPHRQGDERLTGLDETLGSGACAFDYDNDGWVDLFLVNGSGDTRFYGRRHWWQEARGHRLLRNVNGERFVDVSESAGINVVSHGLGCVTADFDNDGLPDIFVTNLGANLLFRNQGDGTFRDVTADSGLGGEGWHTAAAVADVDGDGRLDLYVGGFIAFEKGARTYEPGSQFRQDVPAFFNSALYPALPNHLYRNRGDFKFDDVTEDAGVSDGDGRTLAALWADVNADGRPDLIVLNAAGTGSTTGFMNLGHWKFEPMGFQTHIESGLSYRGIAIGDLDNDGRAEFVLTGATGQQTALLFRDAGEANEGPRFVDRSRPWQLASEQYAALSPWSPGFADLNNDGWTDLVIVNGQILPDPDSPHVTVGQPKQVWLNDGHSHLREYKPPPLSPLLDRQSARGLVVADFNNDGAMDLYVVHNNDLGQLLINEHRSTNHWLGIRLDGVGARVSVTTDQGTQTKWVTKGAGFLSDSDPRLHFGLGAASFASIAVRWPDGSQSEYRDVPLDGYLEVSRQGVTASPAVARPTPIRATSEFGANRPELRAEYFAGLTEVADTAGIDSILRKSLSDPSESVRAAVVKGLADHKSSASLRLLVRFLEDESDSVAALAVTGVCDFQEEDTTRFLLRAFAHPAAIVRRNAADCFTEYNRDFQDQQAVIERKKLATPYLAGLLSDPDTTVRIAAARALGASEEFRGVPPLMELLASDDPALRSESVRAIGLIRDRYALPALLKLAASPDVDPSTYAQLFIALKRLNYSDLDRMMQDFAAGRDTFSTLPSARRLESFLAVLESPEGVVLPRDRIQALSRSALPSGSAADAVLYANIARKSGVAAAAASLRPLLDHGSPEVRSASYLALFALDPPGREALVTRALRDRDASVRNGVLTQIGADEVVLPDALFVAALEDDQTRLAATNALRRVKSDAVTQVLLGWIRDPSAPVELRSAAFAALSRASYSLALTDSMVRGAPEAVRIAMLECEAKRLPAIYVSRTPPPFLARYLQKPTPALRQAVFDFLLTREELWAKQEVVALLHGTDAPELRRHVLQALPASYFRDGGVLMAIAGNSSDPLRLEALRHLRGTEDPSTIQALEALARDANEDPMVRVLAAVALPPAYGEDVLPVLLAGGSSG